MVLPCSCHDTQGTVRTMVEKVLIVENWAAMSRCLIKSVSSGGWDEHSILEREKFGCAGEYAQILGMNFASCLDRLTESLKMASSEEGQEAVSPCQIRKTRSIKFHVESAEKRCESNVELAPSQI